MNRREMLKRALFGGVALTGATGTVLDTVNANNNALMTTEGFRQPKSHRPGAIAIAFGDVIGSSDLPVRPLNAIIPDGNLIYFLWPSLERGDARAYSEFENRNEIIPQRFVFRLRMGEPQAPFYLHWHKGNYYLYTAPGSLVERASFLIRNNNPDDTIQALSDVRQAVILNLTQKGDGQKTLNYIADLDRRCREAKDDELFSYWEIWKELLTATR